MGKNNVKRTILLTMLFLTVWLSFPQMQIFPQEQQKPEEILKNADELFQQQKWEDAWRLYELLLKTFGQTRFISGKSEDIKKKKTECEKKLGIVTNISELFKGKAELKGSGKKRTLTVTYDFKDQAQAEDFNCTGGTAKVVDGKLLFEPEGELSFMNIKNALFTDKITIEAKVTVLKPFSGRMGFLVFLNTDSFEGYMFCLRYREASNESMFNNAILKISQKTEYPTPLKQNSKPEIKADTQYSIKAEAKGKNLTFYVNNKEVVTAEDKDFTKGMFGIISLGNKVQLDDLKITGQANDEWLNKIFAESTTLTLAEDELKESNGEARLVYSDDISAESDELIAKASTAAVNYIADARKRRNNLITSSQEPSRQAWLDLINLCTKAIQEDPDFALAYYERAMNYKEIENYVKSEEDLDKALQIFPGFYEIYNKKAELSLNKLQYDNALELLNKAIEINPNYSTGYSLRALVNFLLDNNDAAKTDLKKALELNKDNVEAKNIQRIINGPDWPACFKKETTHYIVKTDINQERCDAYAEAIEAMFKYYSSLFPLDNKQKKKGRVYIFNTHKGYEIHATLTSGSSLENSLGYYQPSFKELYLFEDPNNHEPTKKVLYHEGFHQYIHTGIEEIPIWFNEGCAEWFYGTTLKNKTVVSKGDICPRLPELQEAVNGGKIQSLDVLMNLSHKEFMGETASLNYAQSWSIIHFCLNYENGKYKGYLEKYFNALKANKPAKDALDASFKTVKDFNKMEQEWKDYVKGLN
ncbi:MAG: DUF1570 domain-containing protein [Planctomycetes bacterium]|nr:DUF1570 domain-containing protein [Planctomycetota bacterium]